MQPGEARPAVSFHREEAPVQEVEHKGRVSVNMDVVVPPRGQGHDYGSNFGYIVSDRETREAASVFYEKVSGPR